VIPLGSLLHLESGTYIAADTGRKIRGKKIDIYMTDCHDAKAFGHRTVPASIVKKGW
jgi:3D (Asp-Asp-Asp) domain-containing protein